MMLLLKMVLAHLLGDFLLQPERWIAEKQSRKHRSPTLYLHVLLHGILTWLLVWDITFWLPVLVIVVSHFTIDLAKIKFQRADNRTAWFIIDQALHLSVLVLLWFAWEHPDLSAWDFPVSRALIVLTAVVLLTNPASIFIKTVISQWTPDTFKTVSGSLPDAGKFIGYLERLLVLLFVLLHHWEAVGFLLAAKSVFRFGNLKESHDRKLTEYVLIGTLLSFSIALVTALVTLYLLNHSQP